MNKARSDAYAEQIKAGLSWVEVRRNSDPFGPEFKVSTVSRNEVFWDWLSREADLSDCRWLMRRRWMDTDEAKATFPEWLRLSIMPLMTGVVLSIPRLLKASPVR